MKRLSKSLVALLVAVVILSSVFTAAFTSEAATLIYSQTSNSGKRDEVCTTLDGTSAASYYTGSYSYETLSGLSSSALLTSLRTLMRSTHTRQSSYNNCRDMATMTDCENENGMITMLYTSYQATYSEYNSGNGWNREHVWPQSLGGGNTSGGGADLHHIRPDENRTNSNRGNKKFGNVSSGSASTGNLSGLVGGTYTSTYFEPNDNVKGDVARICLYVYVRWGSDWGADSITDVFQSISVLLEWCALDPVDTWEMGRNEVVAAYQGNRNVFIDYPELAFQLFNEEVPSDMITPSGNNTSSVTTTATTAANPVVTIAPTVTTKPSVTPSIPENAPLASGSISLYPQIKHETDSDSLSLLYIADSDLIRAYTDTSQKQLTLTVIFYTESTNNSYQYVLTSGSGELSLTNSITLFDTAYSAADGCLLFGMTFEKLSKGNVTEALVTLSDENGIVLSQFTVRFS